MKVYIAGPMTGYPQFNFPAFDEATAALRAQGYDVVSPAELDDAQSREFALASGDGDAAAMPTSYGKVLGRDVTIVIDECQGVVFLPNWWKSRGAKIEALAALLCKHKLFYYMDEGLVPVNPMMVRSLIGVHTDANY